MTVTETSREAYEQIRAGLSHSHSAVLAMIEELGPCHNNRILEALQQADRAKPRRLRRACEWVSNNAWPRVTELIVWYGVVVEMGKYKGVWNGRAVSMNFRRVSGDDRPIPAGWVKVEVKKAEKSRTPNDEKRTPNTLEMGANVAGRVLREYRKVRGRKTTRPTNQLIFNF